MPSVLFVDDERGIVAALSRYFLKAGFDTFGAYGVADAMVAIARAAEGTGPKFDVVCTDLSMPDGNGLEVVRAVRRKLSHAPVVMLTAYASISTTVEAMRLGCVTILEKPIEMASLEKELRSAIGNSKSVAGGVAAAGAAGLVGSSPALSDLLATLARVAPTSSSVLITGESGTGKELVAQAIHSLSRRAQGPLVAVNCAAIPEALLESELFGHVKGAFTGAMSSRAGRFRDAHNGTLFLDEIGELPLALQSKLLRVLQDKSVLPVGASQPEAVDFRLVAATNRNLEDMVATGTFRSDLFYRLNVVPLLLPPLRDRLGDVPVLLKHFIAKFGGKMHIGHEVMAILVAHRWPGNVRELENLVERLSVLRGEGEVLLSDLPTSVRGVATSSPVPSVRPPAPQPAAAPQASPAFLSTPGTQAPLAALSRRPTSLPPNGVDLQAVLADLEDRLIAEALERTGGNRNQAARFLGLNRTTLVEKLRKKARGAGGGTGGGNEPVT